MKKNLFKWKTVSQPKRHHYHPCYPKEQYIMACLQHWTREECFKIGMLFIGPFNRGKWKQSWTKPCVKHIVILLNLYFFLRKVEPQLSLVQCFLLVSGSNPALCFQTIWFLSSLFIAHVCRDSMSPPKLSWNAPIFQSFNPSKPSLFLFNWSDDQFLCLYNLYHGLSDRRAINVPLWFNHWLNYIFWSLAGSQSHFVILLIL